KYFARIDGDGAVVGVFPFWTIAMEPFVDWPLNGINALDGVVEDFNLSFGKNCVADRFAQRDFISFSNYCIIPENKIFLDSLVFKKVVDSADYGPFVQRRERISGD